MFYLLIIISHFLGVCLVLLLSLWKFLLYFLDILHYAKLFLSGVARQEDIED